MKLLITTPLTTIVDATGVTSIRAEDETGAFGILPGHADFLTALAVSVVSWRAGESEHHVALRGGVLSVRNGDEVSILTREAVGEDTLAKLGKAVIERMKRDEESEEASRLASTRMELAAMRQIERYIATGGGRLRPASASAAGNRGAEDELSQSTLT
jgi:F-type H+-transporting ATPase subunit epsilon